MLRMEKKSPIFKAKLSNGEMEEFYPVGCYPEILGKMKNKPISCYFLSVFCNFYESDDVKYIHVLSFDEEKGEGLKVYKIERNNKDSYPGKIWSFLQRK